MKDDELLRGIALALEEEKRTGEAHAKYEALSKNELTPEERAELAKLAETDDEAALALALYAPLGTDFEEQVAQSFLTSETNAPAASAAIAAPTNVAPITAAKARAPRRGNVVRLGSFIAAPLAVAAAVTLLIGRGGQRGEALPPYEIALSSNLHAERAGDTQEPGADARIHRQAFFEVVARPNVAPLGPVVARAALVHDGRVSPWNVPIAISKEGAIRVAGPAATLFPETVGAYDIVIAVASETSLPNEETLAGYARTSGPSPSPSIRVLRAHVRFADD